METKTIILKEFEGKRYELHLLPEKIKKLNIEGHLIYAGSVEDFLKKGNKEEIAEKVVDTDPLFAIAYNDYSDTGFAHIDPVESLMSAIGEYPYIILTESKI